MIRLYLETSISSERVTSIEKSFLDAYLNYLFADLKDLEYQVIPVGGKDKLHLAVNQYEECALSGGRNLTIFDADEAINRGGFEIRRKDLLDKFGELGITSELFLFPNNKDDGDFESLLERIVNKDHSGLLTCFERYENCVKTRNKPGEAPMYKAPNRKAKMYSYVDAMVKSRSKDRVFKGGDWFFDNPEYWDLEADALIPLRSFLEKFVRM